ncbi:MAG TPA: hypothetical protein VGF56_03990 [Rhizomicrobium sp.]|jgi:hypothetical protein
MNGLPLTTLAAFVLHIGGGSVALLSALTAAIARKGGRVHRAGGNIFFWSMLVMAAFAIYLGFAMPDQLVNVFIGILVLYLVGTGWLTVQRPERTIGTPEKIALVVAVILLAPFAILSFQLTLGLPPLFKSAVGFGGPILIAIYLFTTVLAIAALSDAKLVWKGGIAGAPRIARHLWRMCLGLTLAAGSAFTNGFARFLPGPYHVPRAFFLPQLIVLGFLIFWVIRVRLTGWYARNAAVQARQQ